MGKIKAVKNCGKFAKKREKKSKKCKKNTLFSIEKSRLESKIQKR
ncbi:MAG: hypothetical protein ABSG99_06810 [Sedimentisphaerales bacterium]